MIACKCVLKIVLQIIPQQSCFKRKSSIPKFGFLITSRHPLLWGLPGSHISGEPYTRPPYILLCTLPCTLFIRVKTTWHRVQTCLSESFSDVEQTLWAGLVQLGGRIRHRRTRFLQWATLSSVIKLPGLGRICTALPWQTRPEREWPRIINLCSWKRRLTVKELCWLLGRKQGIIQAIC